MSLELAGLSKRYGSFVAVENATLSVERGAFLTLLGPSGSGKTTILMMIAGFTEPSAGRIVLDGRDLTALPPERRDFGMVFQGYALFPHMSVAENVAFPLRVRGMTKAARDEKVRGALDLVQLTGFADRLPKQLSGGQQQRVALARALVLRPRVLLLDESLSNLDARLRESMRHEIREIQRRLGITTLFVTHDQTEALTMCDRIAVMARGRIEQIGSPREIHDRPATKFVAGFVGRSNALALTRHAGGLRAGDAPVVVPRDPGGEVELFVRPQCLILASPSAPPGARNRLTGRVVRTVFVGDRSEILVDTGAGRLVAEMAPGAPPPEDGSEIAVLWTPEDGHAFARES